ncbi:MAG: hypothetical protein JWO30_3250 [Fibrobacteres bacterium]|nr:hypothetical protein [Fibrobacterota bacterium]
MTLMKRIFPQAIFPLILLLSLPAAVSAKDAETGKLPDSSHAVVVKDGAIVFENPDVLANALRLLYAGEVIGIREVLLDPTESKWAKIDMGGVVGYVKFSDIEYSGSSKVKSWRPAVILRDERPLSFSLKAGADMFGGGMGIHYLPFSRLGATFSVGSIIDDGKMKGTSLALGVISYLALENFSPFVETGFTRLSYHESYSILRVDAFYLSAGVEYIFSSGFFVNVMATYLRSADVEVSFDYANAKSGRTEVPANFGVLDPGDDNTFQFLLPGFSLGYAF